MQRARIVIEFASSGNGWEEVYYYPATSIQQGFDAYDSLRVLRILMMANPTQIKSVRVQDPDLPNISQLRSVAAQTLAAYGSQSDNPNQAAMARFYDATGRSRPLYLSGNPDDLWDLNDPQNPDATQWLAAYEQFALFLEGANGGTPWLIQGKPRPVFKAVTGPPPVPVNVTKITAFAATAPGTGTTTVTTDVAHNLVENDFVTLYRMGKIPRAAGLWRVVSKVDPTNFLVPYHFPNGYSYLAGGSMLKDIPAYFPIVAHTLQPLLTRRARGRIFQTTRGRRRSIPR